MTDLATPIYDDLIVQLRPDVDVEAIIERPRWSLADYELRKAATKMLVDSGTIPFIAPKPPKAPARKTTQQKRGTAAQSKENTQK